MESQNSGDVAWMLVATAMVLVMTPALGFFYGGLVRAKNTLNTMMMSYVALGFVGIAWAFIGYTLAFSTGSVWTAWAFIGYTPAFSTGSTGSADWITLFSGALDSRPRARFPTCCSPVT